MNEPSSMLDIMALWWSFKTGGEHRTSDPWPVVDLALDIHEIVSTLQPRDRVRLAEICHDLFDNHLAVMQLGSNRWYWETITNQIRRALQNDYGIDNKKGTTRLPTVSDPRCNPGDIGTDGVDGGALPCVYVCPPHPDRNLRSTQALLL